ncbi:hypothetical protein HanPI659440_Chr09g0343981 [Helianthus annuus]|nr:hypothetical protein HanPI659440_Chr09g0343981 [Helianthus annuus]
MCLSEIDHEHDRFDREENNRKVDDVAPEMDHKDEEDGSVHEVDHVAPEVVEEPPPPPLKPEKKVRVSVPVLPENRRSSGKGGQSLDLLQIFTELDDCFLKASESASEVSKMLEANRLHYHSNFADSKGHIDHSARVMRVITWNRSFKGLPEIKPPLSLQRIRSGIRVFLGKMMCFDLL